MQIQPWMIAALATAIIGLWLAVRTRRVAPATGRPRTAASRMITRLALAQGPMVLAFIAGLVVLGLIATTSGPTRVLLMMVAAIAAIIAGDYLNRKKELKVAGWALIGAGGLIAVVQILGLVSTNFTGLKPLLTWFGGFDSSTQIVLAAAALTLCFAIAGFYYIVKAGEGKVTKKLAYAIGGLAVTTVVLFVIFGDSLWALLGAFEVARDANVTNLTEVLKNPDRNTISGLPWETEVWPWLITAVITLFLVSLAWRTWGGTAAFLFGLLMTASLGYYAFTVNSTFQKALTSAQEELHDWQETRREAKLEQAKLERAAAVARAEAVAAEAATKQKLASATPSDEERAAYELFWQQKQAVSAVNPCDSIAWQTVTVLSTTEVYPLPIPAADQRYDIWSEHTALKFKPSANAPWQPYLPQETVYQMGLQKTTPGTNPVIAKWRFLPLSAKCYPG